MLTEGALEDVTPDLNELTPGIGSQITNEDPHVPPTPLFEALCVCDCIFFLIVVKYTEHKTYHPNHSTRGQFGSANALTSPHPPFSLRLFIYRA